MRRIHAASSRVLSSVLLVLGLLMIVATLSRGGGPAAVGVILGVAFAAVGAARLWLSRHLRAR